MTNEHWVMKEISQKFYFRYGSNDEIIYDEKRIRKEVEEKLQEKLGHSMFGKNARRNQTKVVSTLYRNLRQFRDRAKDIGNRSKTALQRMFRV